MTQPVDNLDLPEVRQSAEESTKELLDRIERDKVALKLDDDSSSSSAAISEQSYEDVNNAAPGVFNQDDYSSSVQSPTTGSSDDAFSSIFEDVKSLVLSEVTKDQNLSLRLSLQQAVDFIVELEALGLQIISESSKISIAANAGLLVPPSRVDVEELKSQTQSSLDETKSSIKEVEAAKYRRQSARGRLPREVIGRVAEGQEIDVDGRGRAIAEIPSQSSSEENQPTRVKLNIASTSESSQIVDKQASAPGRTSESMQKSLEVLQGSVLDKVSYIAICTALSSISTSKETQDRAIEVIGKLKSIVDLFMSGLGSGFASALQNGIQELASDVMSELGGYLQDKIDAFDEYLSFDLPRPRTSITTVKSIGDRASAIPVTEDLAAKCGLKFESFCDTQGLIEIAKSLEVEIGIVLPRLPAIGRARLVLDPPDKTQEVQDVANTPDGEALLLTNGFVANGSSSFSARLRGQDVTREIDQSSLTASATLSDDLESGSRDIVLTGWSSPVADFGVITIDPGGPNEETFEYADGEFATLTKNVTLASGASTDHLAGTSVIVSSEWRDSFSSSYSGLEQIRGGPGKMIIRGEREIREEISYSSSTFDTATGVYDFSLDSPTVGDHYLLLIGRPREKNKSILFKDTSSPSIPADRFQFTGGGPTYTTIQYESGSLNANLTTQISLFRHGVGADYGLIIGSDKFPVSVAAVSPTTITLTKPWHGENTVGLSGLTISEIKIENPAGVTEIETVLDEKAQKDLGIDDMIVAETRSISGKILIDAGAGTERVNDSTGSLSSKTSSSPTLTSLAPVFRPGDVGSEIIVNGDANVALGTQAQQLTGTISSYTDSRTVDLTGLVDQSGNPPAYPGAPGPTVSTIIFSFVRNPKEVRVFESVERFSDNSFVFSWAFSGVSEDKNYTSFEHRQQRVDVTPSVQIIPDSIDSFIAAPNPVTPRFDDDTYPPGTPTLRARFEDPLQEAVLSLFIESSTSGIINERELEFSAPGSAVDGQYTFQLDDPSPVAYSSGDIIEIETTSVFDQLDLEFGDGSWADPIDDWIENLVKKISQLEGRMCLMLSGRPLDIGVTANQVAAITSLGLLALVPLRLKLQSMVLGLPESEKLAEAQVTLESAGMDQAAEKLKSGDIVGIVEMDASESTIEGKTVAELQAYKKQVEITPEAIKVDATANLVRGNLKNKQIAARARLGFSKNYKNDADRQRVKAEKALGDTRSLGK